ncbi:CATRA system-associated protein [Amycolatopsis sp. cg9]|uniref:CATRA system-associated protein n=1 Tax=Amycolatopsis sp. cg9 TaxID=3238801 RepID=UPI0035253F27
MTVDRELAREASEALNWTVRLRLSPTEWSYAEQIMTALGEAMAHEDEAALQDATQALDRLARRVSEKLGKEPDREPASPKQRDRVAELVHKLDTDPGKGEKPPAKPK